MIHDSERIALSSISILFLTVFVAMAGFFFGLSIGIFIPITVLVLIVAYALLFDRRFLYTGLLCLGLLALWAVICYFLFDWSFDGMYYHKQAIITLKEGWNPLRESSLSADVFASYPDMALWLDNYPKGIWIVSAVIYGVTNLLETAKAVNILFLIPVFSLSFDVLRHVYQYSKTKSVVFSVLFVLNPVFICQVFTSYNDLAVGALVIMAALIGIKIYNNCANRYTYAILFGICTISCTVKFTAPVLVGIVLLATGVCYAIREKWDRKKLIKPIMIVLLGFFAGVAVLGFDPYVKHIMEGKHILHPVMGSEKYDIMNTNPPAGMEDKNAVEKVFYSLFSKTGNSIDQEPVLKVPFRIYKDEWIHLSNADIRIGGFGVLFGGILILSILLLLLNILNKQKWKPGVLIFLVLFSVLTLFFPESWWARYTSYTYYIPVLILLYGSGRWDWLRNTIAVLLIANSMLFATAVVTNGLEITKLLHTRLEEVRSHNQKVIVRVNDFPSHVKLFSESGIDYEVSHVSLKEPHIFYRSTKYLYEDEVH